MQWVEKSDVDFLSFFRLKLYLWITHDCCSDCRISQWQPLYMYSKLSLSTAKA